MRHGIPCVHGQVEDDLLDLSRIGFDPGQGRVQFGFQFDVLANKPPQHLLHVLDYCVEVQNLGVKHLLAAEGEKLSGERSGPMRSFENLVDAAATKVESTASSAASSRSFGSMFPIPW